MKRGPCNTKRGPVVEALALRIALDVHRTPRTGEQLRDDHAVRSSSATDIPRAIKLATDRGWILHGGRLGSSVLWTPGRMPTTAEMRPTAPGLARAA